MTHFENNTIMVIFGATGDLTTTKLIPALFNLHKNNLLPQEFKVVAFSRRDYSDSDFYQYLESFSENQKNSSSIQWKSFLNRISYIKGDFQNLDSYSNLAQYLNEIDEKENLCTNKIFYMAISPDLYDSVIRGLQNTHIKQICKSKANIRIVLEKPFGKDLSSFKTLNSALLKHYEESQIFRIDHYLGKETVQNIFHFRKFNPFFSQLWNPKNISKVHIKAYESNGIGTRGSYYDKYGQTRDMIQSHLLQLLAITLMDLTEKPTTDSLSKAKIEILKSLRMTDASQIKRGQYINGIVNGEKSCSYKEELNIPSNSETETYIKVSPTLTNKWKGLKIILESGKRLTEKLTEIEICFQSKDVFNKLTFRIQPNESIILSLNVKKPYSSESKKVDMKYLYREDSVEILPTAYEKILLNLILLETTTFVSTSELEESWKFTDTLIKSFPKIELIKYPAGIDPKEIKQIS